MFRVFHSLDFEAEEMNSNKIGFDSSATLSEQATRQLV